MNALISFSTELSPVFVIVVVFVLVIVIVMVLTLFLMFLPAAWFRAQNGFAKKNPFQQMFLPRRTGPAS
jgi:hypothetical protein